MDREQELLEKVVEGLECCVIDGGCGACPYDSLKDCPGSHPTPETLMKDALALLKRQEANDAIPLKWMREKIKLYCVFGDYKTAAWINDLVHWWQREAREAQTHAEAPEAVE